MRILTLRDGDKRVIIKIKAITHIIIHASKTNENKIEIANASGDYTIFGMFSDNIGSLMRDIFKEKKDIEWIVDGLQL